MIIWKPLNEKNSTGLQEMAVLSTRNDKGLIDIDIFVYGSKQKEVPHAHIVKRTNHTIALGRFVITSNKMPTKIEDIQEVKEAIESSYKNQIINWVKERSHNFPKQTNWEATRGMWNSLNPNNIIRNL
jgi:hypothetical protein